MAFTTQFVYNPRYLLLISQTKVKALIFAKVRVRIRNVVEGSLLRLALSDARITAAVTCFCSDGTGKLSGHPQKLYLHTLASFLPKHLTILWVQLEGLHKFWCPMEISWSTLSTNNACQLLGTITDAAMETYVPPLKKRLVKASRKVPHQYTNTKPGTVLDDYEA